MFVHDPALGGAAPWNPAVIDNFIAVVGGKPGAWHWFAPLSYDFTSANFDAVDSRGMNPILSWAPEVSDAAIVSGQKDAVIRKFAQDAKAWGKPFYLRLGWEMNLPEIGPWAVGVEGNTSADFVAMWKHVHDIFTAEGATNERWFWCPGEIGIGPSFDSLYPGDAYVDVAGFDAYNWGNLRHWATWQSLAEVYGSSYSTIAALTQKPMIIGETGSPEGGGDKAAWIRQGFLTDLPVKFPRIIGVVYFNQDEARVNTSDASLNAFKEVVASPLYKGKLP